VLWLALLPPLLPLQQMSQHLLLLLLHVRTPVPAATC
jgi:hypothetical protein